MRFAKAHGLGNDFILIAESDLPSDWSAFAIRVCDRNRGIGGDGVLTYAVDASRGVARMRLLNPDGSDGQISGNGVRCVGAYVHFLGLLPAEHVVHPPPGERPVRVTRESATLFTVDTNLGVPELRAARIPSLFEGVERVVDHPLDVDGEIVRVTCCSMGNPHAAVFVEAAVADSEMRRLGPKIERHPMFPDRTNVEFVTPLSRTKLQVRFWERGVGPTLASGTGSASALVAAVMNGRTEREVTVRCPGGALWERWESDGSPLNQRAPVAIVFEGVLL